MCVATLVWFIILCVNFWCFGLEQTFTAYKKFLYKIILCVCVCVCVRARAHMWLKKYKHTHTYIYICVCVCFLQGLNTCNMLCVSFSVPRCIWVTASVSTCAWFSRLHISIHWKSICINFCLNVLRFKLGLNLNLLLGQSYCTVHSTVLY